ncbi:MAG: hypothetical protein A2Y15_07965 [Clostridiales bacterium GWF2_36_10]|nr:MAG: hypothetical protein A2Y15_07965 [Clostridiales bacterium GWF2_36_10]HAN20281.1 hypothetical protein [Clostridiales bacterium]
MNNPDKNNKSGLQKKTNPQKRVSPQKSLSKQIPKKIINNQKAPSEKKQVNRVTTQAPKKFKRKHSPARKQRVTAILVLLLTIYLIINLFIAGLIYFSFDIESKNADVYSLQLNYNEKKVFAFEATQVNNAYGLYVPFEKLSTICDLSIIGDSKNVVIMISPDSGTIRCMKDSSLVYINDNAVRLSMPILFEATDYMIPVELVDSYLIGVDVAYDKEKLLCTISTTMDSVISLKMQLPTELEKTTFSDDYTSETSDISGDDNDENS